MKKWFLKKEVSDTTIITDRKDKFFRPADYLELNTILDDSQVIVSIKDDIAAIEAEIRSPLQYKEFTYTGDNITSQSIYIDNTMTTQLYEITYSYTGDNLTGIQVERISDGFIYNKTLSYDINNNLINIDIHE